MDTTTINPNRVEEILVDSLYQDLPPDTTRETLPEGAIVTEGIMNTYAFDPERIEKHRKEVAEILHQMRKEFFDTTGGGWSFLNLCNDNQGRLWTGEQRIMDLLCCLGFGLDMMKWQMPRSMWSVMPGGMPYLVIYRAKVDEALLEEDIKKG